MPFGKANSSNYFREWTDLWFISLLYHFRKANPFHAVLGSYVDDIFGGARTQAQARAMIDELNAMGLLLCYSFLPYWG